MFFRNNGHTFQDVPLSYNGSLYIIANIIFIVGCVCFMPMYDENNEDTLKGGIALFTIGSIIFLVAPMWNIYRTIEFKRHQKINELSYRTEISVGIAYILGSALFVVGSILFLPQYYDNGIQTEEAAVGCFIWGSACFLLATIITSLIHLFLMVRRFIHECTKGKEEMSQGILPSNSLTLTSTS